MLHVRTRGQSTLEVIILIGFVVAGLIAMGVYVRRGIQGGVRSATDQIGEQYSAGRTASYYSSNSTMVSTENVTAADGKAFTNLSTNMQNSTGNETVEKFDGSSPAGFTGW